MKTSDFDYHLPRELIAQEPVPVRSASRMMVVHRDTGGLEHGMFTDLPDYLESGDLLVLNKTRVFPARIFGKRTDTGGKVELLLVEEITESNQSVMWNCFLKARSRPPVGTGLSLANGRIEAKVLAVHGERVVLELAGEAPLFDILEEEGVPPVPPYIKRDYRSKLETGNSKLDVSVEMDRERYQTVYAQDTGSVAAPTAGLHFTEDIFNRLDNDGIRCVEIVLHVGPGTFRPVSADDVEEHEMEAERYEVTPAAADAVNTTRKNGGRVIAVGSTTVRTLETAAQADGMVAPGQGRSTLFIYPPYDFRAVDVMLTNFHLPRSTLLMMVSALAGRELILDAYREARKEKYRFYSYGDCMLII